MVKWDGSLIVLSDNTAGVGASAVEVDGSLEQVVGVGTSAAGVDGSLVLPVSVIGAVQVI